MKKVMAIGIFVCLTGFFVGCSKQEQKVGDKDQAVYVFILGQIRDTTNQELDRLVELYAPKSGETLTKEQIDKEYETSMLRLSESYQKALNEEGQIKYLEDLNEDFHNYMRDISVVYFNKLLSFNHIDAQLDTSISYNELGSNKLLREEFPDELDLYLIRITQGSILMPE